MTRVTRATSMTSRALAASRGSASRFARRPTSRAIIARTTIGASVWQTPGGIQSELARINDDFLATSHELTELVAAVGYPANVRPQARPLIDLFERTWGPLINAWTEFYASNNGWWGNLWWNHAPEAEQLHAKLGEVRARIKELAARAGEAVTSPDVTTFSPSALLDPHKNLIDDLPAAGKKVADSLLSVIKTVIFLALGIGALLLGLSVYSRSRMLGAGASGWIGR